MTTDPLALDPVDKRSSPVLDRVETAGPVELPGRGTTWVRRIAGPRGAPTVLLLHGWTATADVNWRTSYRALSRQVSVVALDHRGHGRGIRSPEPFRLSDCADDAAALCELLGLEQVIAVGYSMGGPIAQLLWRRHPWRVAGLVLCATAATFSEHRRERLVFQGLTGLSVAARLAPPAVRSNLALRIMAGRSAGDQRPRVLDHDWLRIVEAGRSIGRFDSRGWIERVDVPHACVVTLDDEVVSRRRQLDLAELLPNPSIHAVAAGHGAPLSDAARFVPRLLDAVTCVR